MVGQRPQQTFMTPLLVGTDGAHKMSKSLGNFYTIEDVKKHGIHPLALRLLFLQSGIIWEH